MGLNELNALESAARMPGEASGSICFRLGMFYSVGGAVPADKIAAHKWFNLAVVRGIRDAIAYRRELSAEMTEAEIAAAQRAAREWIAATAH